MSMPEESKHFRIVDFGLSAYEEIWQAQKELLQQRAMGLIPDTLMLGEHFPVITTGRGGHAENLLNPTLPVVAVERGGDVTYHGPGQLVAYPIIQLPPERRDLHRYLRDLETVVMGALRSFGLEGIRQPGKTGVWIRDPLSGRILKMASIGVAVTRWITYHGLSLNVAPDLSHFAQINPCGFPGDVMTSMHCFMGDATPSVGMMKMLLAQNFQAVFND